MLYYEIRQAGSPFGKDGWYSAGAATAIHWPAPTGVGSEMPFYIEIRACDSEGRFGDAVKSEALYLTPTPNAADAWALYR